MPKYLKVMLSRSEFTTVFLRVPDCFDDVDLDLLGPLMSSWEFDWKQDDEICIGESVEAEASEAEDCDFIDLCPDIQAD